MNDINSIKKSVEIFKKHGTKYALLHCTNVYPTPDRLIRFGALEEMMKEFPEAVVGLSDHSKDNLACIGAISVGASIVERHFADNKSRPGPDITCSMDGMELKNLINSSKKASFYVAARKALLKRKVQQFVLHTLVLSQFKILQKVKNLHLRIFGLRGRVQAII